MTEEGRWSGFVWRVGARWGGGGGGSLTYLTHLEVRMPSEMVMLWIESPPRCPEALPGQGGP